MKVSAPIRTGIRDGLLLAALALLTTSSFSVEATDHREYEVTSEDYGPMTNYTILHHGKLVDSGVTAAFLRVPVEVRKGAHPHVKNTLDTEDGDFQAYVIAGGQQAILVYNHLLMRMPVRIPASVLASPSPLRARLIRFDDRATGFILHAEYEGSFAVVLNVENRVLSLITDLKSHFVNPGYAELVMKEFVEGTSVSFHAAPDVSILDPKSPVYKRATELEPPSQSQRRPSQIEAEAPMGDNATYDLEPTHFVHRPAQVYRLGKPDEFLGVYLDGRVALMRGNGISGEEDVEELADELEDYAYLVPIPPRVVDGRPGLPLVTVLEAEDQVHLKYPGHPSLTFEIERFRKSSCRWWLHEDGSSSTDLPEWSPPPKDQRGEI